MEAPGIKILEATRATAGCCKSFFQPDISDAEHTSISARAREEEQETRRVFLAALPADVGEETPPFVSHTQSEQSNKLLLEGERERLAFIAPFLLYNENHP